MSLEDMKYEIERFVEHYSGTAIGQSIYNKLSNADEDDYDEIYDIYTEVMDIL